MVQIGRRTSRTDKGRERMKDKLHRLNIQISLLGWWDGFWMWRDIEKMIKKNDCLWGEEKCHRNPKECTAIHSCDKTTEKAVKK